MNVTGLMPSRISHLGASPEQQMGQAIEHPSQVVQVVRHLTGVGR